MAAASQAQPHGWHLDAAHHWVFDALHGHFFEGPVFTLLLSFFARLMGAARAATVFFRSPQETPRHDD